MIDDVIDHLRNRDYMSGVERDKSRVKATGEVFTPTPLVQEMLDQLPTEVFTDPNKTFLEPSCGDGQFLSEVVIRKMENGSTYEQALSTVYGIDLMEDNCVECIKRLYMCEDGDITPLNQEEAKLLEPDYYWAPGLIKLFYVAAPHYTGITNIVCGDGLKYDYSFGTYVAPVKTPKELAAEERKRLKAESKKKNVVHKWIDEVSDLFDFKS